MSTLTRITSEAKRIRKKHPGKSWRTAVKEAGRKYRTGKLGARPKPAKKKKAAKVRPKRISRPARKRTTVTVTKSKRVVGNAAFAIPSGTPGQHISAAKRLLVSQLGVLEARKFSASKMKEKRQIQKSITSVRKQINRLK